MIAVDILEVPVSKNNNVYFMDFTKWAEAIPLKIQTAVRITEKLLRPGKRQTLEAFRTKKTHTTPSYVPSR